MLRRIIALTILLTMVSGPLVRLSILSDYVVRNAAYLAACENLARPEMQCNGTCQLSKKLKAIEDQGAPEPLSSDWLKQKVGEFITTDLAIVHRTSNFMHWHSDEYVPQQIGLLKRSVEATVPPPKMS